MSNEQTYWNGLPTPARRGTAVVADAPEFAAYWARDLVGERIAVVEVKLDGVNYGGGLTYLDDRQGDGWAKVTEGRGGSAWGHASVHIDGGSFVETAPELSEPERIRVEAFGLDKPEQSKEA